MQGHNLDSTMQGHKSMLGLHNLISTPPIGLVFTYIGLTNIIIRAKHHSQSNSHSHHHQYAVKLYQSDRLLSPQLRDSFVVNLHTHQCKPPKLLQTARGNSGEPSKTSLPFPLF